MYMFLFIQDSAFVEIEKSPEERGYDLFHKYTNLIFSFFFFL